MLQRLDLSHLKHLKPSPDPTSLSPHHVCPVLDRRVAAGITTLPVAPLSPEGKFAVLYQLPECRPQCPTGYIDIQALPDISDALTADDTTDFHDASENRPLGCIRP